MLRKTQKSRIASQQNLLAGKRRKLINYALSSLVDFTCLNTGDAHVHSLDH